PPSPAYRPPFPRRPFNTPARRSGRPHLPDLSQMSGPWASAATPAAKVTHLKERLQRLSHTNGRRLPASRSLGPPHQARLPRSAPEFRPSDALHTHGDDGRTGFAAAAPLTPRHKPGAVG